MRTIYVDDEEMMLERFQMTVKEITEIEELKLFHSSTQALGWVKENPVDVAFLDIEMPEMNGIELAGKLKEIDENIQIVFVTAYEKYALEAFGVDAIFMKYLHISLTQWINTTGNIYSAFHGRRREKPSLTICKKSKKMKSVRVL